jgi:hypothetical protein
MTAKYVQQLKTLTETRLMNTGDMVTSAQQLKTLTATRQSRIIDN